LRRDLFRPLIVRRRGILIHSFKLPAEVFFALTGGFNLSPPLCQLSLLFFGFGKCRFLLLLLFRLPQLALPDLLFEGFQASIGFLTLLGEVILLGPCTLPKAILSAKSYYIYSLKKTYSRTRVARS
jgi:hypothetical protein